MKKLCVIFVLAPMVLLPFVVLWPDGIGGWLSWPWILCTVTCIICGFSIYRRQCWLGRACLIVGFLNLTLVVLLPILMTPKTRKGVSVEPGASGNSRSAAILIGHKYTGITVASDAPPPAVPDLGR